jgi:hypothetical protein
MTGFNEISRPGRIQIRALSRIHIFTSFKVMHPVFLLLISVIVVSERRTLEINLTVDVTVLCVDFVNFSPSHSI